MINFIKTRISVRYSRSTSVPPSISFSSLNAATPFRDRANSVPPAYFHYSDFDYKVIDYMNQLRREDMVKTSVSQANARTNKYADPFSSRYSFYDSNKYDSGYLYPFSNNVLGSWKHFNLSNQTLNERNETGVSPLMARELNRLEKHRMIKKKTFIHSEISF